MRGTYRIWCPAPDKIYKVIIYRHRRWITSLYNNNVVIGLEFFNSREMEPSSRLLGHRTLLMEHAIQLEFEEAEEVVGFRVKANTEEHASGLDSVEVSIS